LGYLCGFRCDFNHQSPVIAKMLEAFDSVEYAGKPLSSYKVLWTGGQVLHCDIEIFDLLKLTRLSSADGPL